MQIKLYINGISFSGINLATITGNLIFYDDDAHQFWELDDNPISFSFNNLEDYKNWYDLWKDICIWPESEEK